MKFQLNLSTYEAIALGVLFGAISGLLMYVSIIFLAVPAASLIYLMRDTLFKKKEVK